MPIVFHEDFSAYETGEQPARWLPQTGVENQEVVGAAKMLRVSSTGSTSGALACRVSCPERLITTLALTLRFPTRDGVGERVGLQETHLSDAQGRKICACTIENGRFLFAPNTPRRAHKGPVSGLAVQPHTDYRIEIRYFRARGTYDVLVNNEFLVEEAECAAGHTVGSIVVSVGAGTDVLFDDVLVRCADHPLKQQLGTLIPVDTIDHIGFSLVRHLAIPATTIVMHDFDNDGQPELVTGDPEQPGALCVYQVHGTAFDWTKLRSVVVEPTSTGALAPCGMIGEQLAVFGFRNALPDEHGGMHQQGRFCLLRVCSDLTFNVEFSRSYEEACSGTVVPVDYGDGRRGFAVGLAYPNRVLELFEVGTNAAEQLAAPIGLYELHKPDVPSASDIKSMVPCDWDGDDAEDLFIGWGYWDGYAPALLILKNGIPAGVQPHGSSPVEAGAPRVVYVQPLTEPIGETHLALSHVETGVPHLAAVSRQTRTREPSVLTSGHGVRVWRVSDIRADKYTDPLWFKPEDAWAVAAGTIAGREVFATASYEPVLGEVDHDLVFRVYGIDDGGVAELWAASVFCGKKRDVELSFADVNGDGEQELLANLGRQGILVFSTRDDAAN